MNDMNDTAEKSEESLKNSDTVAETGKIQKTVLIAELVEKHPELVEPLMMMGMHCISCFASQMETLEEAAMVHGLNPDEVVADLNDFLADMQEQASKNA